MRNHHEKARDMARSVLPSTARTSARSMRAQIHGRERAHERQLLHDLRRCPDPDDYGACLGLSDRHRRDVADMVDHRRSWDKVGPSSGGPSASSGATRTSRTGRPRTARPTSARSSRRGWPATTPSPSSGGCSRTVTASRSVGTEAVRPVRPSPTERMQSNPWTPTPGTRPENTLRTAGRHDGIHFDALRDE